MFSLCSGWQDTAAYLFEAGGAKVDKDLIAATRFGCPDCKRLVKSWEEAEYKRPEQGGPKHEFSNKKWQHAKLIEASAKAAASSSSSAAPAHGHPHAAAASHHEHAEQAAHAAAKHRDLKVPSA